MRFTKMHGLGNDYIFINCMAGTPDGLPELARRLSDRHFGVGGDGIICVCPSQRADFKMRMFNADGSEGAMCGNGIRCFGKYVYDKGLTNKRHLAVETGAGERELSLLIRDGAAAGAAVGMGVPVVQPPVVLAIGDREYEAVPVSMGNPHAVIEADAPAALDLTALGPQVERHPAFPGRVNAEFVRVVNRRGRCGCGSGAAGKRWPAAPGRARRRRPWPPWESWSGRRWYTWPGGICRCAGRKNPAKCS